MPEAATRQELEAAHCWENDDRVPGRPTMTEFRRQSRYQQARWREAQGHPAGTQPIVPKPGGPVRPVGSRIPLAYGREHGANFLTANAFDAAKARMGAVEAHQSVDHQRLWADLLSSAALSFNLFGDLAADLDLADRALHAWFPAAPGRVSAVKFAHSPGRLDASYLANLSSFDAAFILELGDGTRGVVAVDVKYHERNKPETPKPQNLARYTEVAQRSNAFARTGVESLQGRSDLCVMWLGHLLLHSMLQHQSGEWAWGRYVVVHPARNSDVAEACRRYKALLADDSTYATLTLEHLVASGALPQATAVALRDRYLGT
jgi:hypothetical protein